MVWDFSCSSARRVLLKGATSLSKASFRSSSSLILRPVSVSRLRRTSFSSPIREPTSDKLSTEIWSPPFPFRGRPKSLSTSAGVPFRPNRSDSFAMTTPPQPQKRLRTAPNAAFSRLRYYIAVAMGTLAAVACEFRRARPALSDKAVRDVRGRTVHRYFRQTRELCLSAVSVWATPDLHSLGGWARLDGGNSVRAHSVPQHSPPAHVVSADQHATTALCC